MTSAYDATSKYKAYTTPLTGLQRNDERMEWCATRPASQCTTHGTERIRSMDDNAQHVYAGDRKRKRGSPCCCVLLTELKNASKRRSRWFCSAHLTHIKVCFCLLGAICGNARAMGTPGNEHKLCSLQASESPARPATSTICVHNNCRRQQFVVVYKQH